MSDYDVEILSAEWGPCPVCGAEGGNCKGESHYRGSITIEPRKRKDPRATFRVPHRIYETVWVGKRKTKKLLYSQGESITPAEAKRLGLLPDKDKPKRSE